MLNTKNCPSSEYSLQFLQGMVDRMSVSYHKYGAVADAFPQKVNAIESMHQRLEMYYKTSNTEYLVDAANFLMVEFMHPAVKDAFFKPTDSDGSCGRATYDSNFEGTQKSNKELTNNEWNTLKELC